LAIQTCDCWFIWSNWNKSSLGQKFDIIVGQVWFKEKKIVYVKDEGSNFNEMTSVLKFIIDCEYLGLEESSRVLALNMRFQKHVNMAF
jgi:hypothetical protein